MTLLEPSTRPMIPVVADPGVRRRMEPAPTSTSSRAGLFLALGLFFFTAACAGPGRCGGIGWTDSHGVQHIVIVGFGIVSFTNGPVSALDARSLGIVLDRGLSAGLVERHEVVIDPDQASNAVVSINARPFGLRVTNFDFRQTNLNWNPFWTEGATRP